MPLKKSIFGFLNWHSTKNKNWRKIMRSQADFVVLKKTALKINSVSKVKLQGDLQNTLFTLKKRAKEENALFEMEVNGFLICVHAESDLNELWNMALFSNTHGFQE